MTTRARRDIRAELTAELSLDSPDLDRVSALSAELEQARRFRRRRSRGEADRAPAADRSVVAPQVHDADAEAIKTWPPELRARLRDRATSRQILPWRD
ncbi:hypothetical protein ACFVYV_40270 [Streptomyces mirabilis]|uniref:hypothetical protein n=1 Tax=Streptomyces mirabilis TaxID=68239 RepID=UPI0036DA41F6